MRTKVQGQKVPRGLFEAKDELPASPSRIVVLDDDDDFPKLISALLEDQEPGISVIVGDKADDAIGLVKQERPSLVILDVLFDREQLGWSVLDRLKADPETTNIPVLMCTASPRLAREHQTMLERYGIQTISKPFYIVDFISAVRTALTTAACTHSPD